MTDFPRYLDYLAMAVLPYTSFSKVPRAVTARSICKSGGLRSTAQENLLQRSRVFEICVPAFQYIFIRLSLGIPNQCSDCHNFFFQITFLRVFSYSVTCSGEWSIRIQRSMNSSLGLTYGQVKAIAFWVWSYSFMSIVDISFTVFIHQIVAGLI